MASTYVNNLRLEEIGTGEQSGTWGATTNTNLELIASAVSYSFTGEAIANASTHTITMVDGAADEFRSFYLKCTGGGQACTVTLAPNTLSKVWMIENTTSYTLTFSQGSGANVAVAAGEVKMIATDGAGSGAVVYDLFTDVNFAGTTALAALKLGGTTVSATAAELNYNDTGASVGTVVASKVVTVDANKDVSSFRNITLTGELDAGSLDISGDADIDGTLETDAFSIAGTTVSATAAELNYNATGVSVGTVAASKAVIADANKDVTGMRNLTLTGDLTVGGDDLTMGTNTSGMLLVADGTNFNPTAVSSLSEISTAASDDLYLSVDTSGGGLKKITRSTMLAGTGSSSDLANVVEDTSPQLGGNLDTNQQDIVTVSNRDLDLAPNGTGTVVIRGNTNSGAVVFNCESNSHGQKVYGQPHSAGVTNTLMLPAGANSTLVSLVSTDTLTNKTLTSPKINEDVAVTTTATEINLIDGGTSRGTTAVASGDGILINDAGTMRMTNVDTVSTYFSSISVGGGNIVTTGALNSGSITSGFGAIDNGSSNITTTGVGTFGSLDISGNIDIDGTTNLDAVDIDGAVQLDATLTVGVDDTGYDVKFFGDTASAFMQWDASADDLILGGAAGLVLPKDKLTIDSTAVTTTAAELNKLDGAGTLKQAGKESIYVPATAMYPSTTNPCSDLTQVETTALRPDLKVLDFADGADDFAQFSVAFPKSWNEGTVTFQPFWTVTGTNTGTVAWQLAGVAITSDESINTAFGTQVATTALAFSGTSNDLMVSAESGAVTIAGSPAAADMCFFQINRDISADTQTGDARLLGVKLLFTTDAANDA